MSTAAACALRLVLALVGAGLLAVAVLGCSDGGCPPATPGSALGGYPEPGQQAPHVAAVTTTGVHLRYPAWLDKHPSGARWHGLMLDEIAFAQPEADSRIPPSTRGVPAGLTVVVLDPGPYWAPYSPTGRAAGEWRAPRTIYVAWRSPETGPVLPALAHELRHAITGDPAAGH